LNNQKQNYEKHLKEKEEDLKEFMNKKGKRDEKDFEREFKFKEEDLKEEMLDYEMAIKEQ